MCKLLILLLFYYLQFVYFAFCLKNLIGFCYRLAREQSCREALPGSGAMKPFFFKMVLHSFRLLIFDKKTKTIVVGCSNNKVMELEKANDYALAPRGCTEI